MRCQKLRSLLPAYCSRELDGSVTATMEIHFHDCSQCREDLAAHRLISATISSLADSAPNESHSQVTPTTEPLTSPLVEHPFDEPFESPAMNKPTFKPLRVSADFNNKLMERIAQERFSETRTKARSKARSKAFLPQSAPLFNYRRLIPAVVSITAVAALAFVSMQQGIFDSPGSSAERLMANNSSVNNSSANNSSANNSSANNSSATMFTADKQALAAPAIGERIGLTDEYMTAEPINNPLYSRSFDKSSANSSLPATSQGASLVSASGPRQLSSSRRWHFARDYARARRILSISNELCRRGAYFQIVQFDANGTPTGTGNVVFFGPTTHRRIVGSPQIIVQPLPNAPAREQTPQGRMVRGTF